MRSAFSPSIAGSTTTSSSAVITSTPISIVRLAMPPFAHGAVSPNLRVPDKLQSCHFGYQRPPIGNLTMPGSGTVRRKRCRAPFEPTLSPAEPARRDAVRRRRPSHDAEPCGQAGHALPLLCLAPADHQRTDRTFRRAADPRRGDRATRDRPGAPMASQSRQASTRQYGFRICRSSVGSARERRKSATAGRTCPLRASAPC